MRPACVVLPMVTAVMARTTAVLPTVAKAHLVMPALMMEMTAALAQIAAVRLTVMLSALRMSVALPKGKVLERSLAFDHS